MFVGSAIRVAAPPVLLAAALTLPGCGTPASQFDQHAAGLGLDRHVVRELEFDHAIYEKSGTRSGRLHVYLDGDGTPWIAGRPADDPTPRDPLVLRLMALDPSPAIYIGRPCYNGLRRSNGCEAAVWTSARYSERVVASMAAALRRERAERAETDVILFGYSGGGTLAVLLAEKVPDTSAVVTVAANLDVDAWAADTAQRLLRGSLNPAARARLAATIRQRHYVGGRDRVVRPEITASAVSGTHVETIRVADYDHVCCWERAWPSVLASLPTRDADADGPAGVEASRSEADP